MDSNHRVNLLLAVHAGGAQRSRRSSGKEEGSEDNQEFPHGGVVFVLLGFFAFGVSEDDQSDQIL